MQPFTTFSINYNIYFKKRNNYLKLMHKKNDSRKLSFQTVDKTLLVSTPEAFFLFSVQKVCT